MQFLAILSFLFLKAANGFGTRRDHVHKGPILQTIYGLDWLSCLVACSHNGRCFSYNYKGTTEREEGNSICQLLDSLDFDKCNSEETSNFLVYAPGFIFHQIQANVKDFHYKDKWRQKGTKRDCYEVLLAGQKESGIYTISPDGQQEFDVYCDQRTEGGGWTVFQKRFYGTVDFFEDWKSYTDGFGNLGNEFWLGFNKIYRLTSGIRNSLRIDLGDFKNASSYAEYDSFKVLDEDNSYELQLGNFTGTSGDSLTWHDRFPFSTKDRNHGDCHEDNCAVFYHGAWWYVDASLRSNLNGRYYPQETSASDAIIWEKWRGSNTTLKRTEMKVRPYI